MNENFWPVNFALYCGLCKHSKKREYEDPCFKCLDESYNGGSRVPVKFEEAPKKTRKEKSNA